MINYLVFLVMLHSGTEKPTISLLMPFPTVKECNALLAKAPKEDAKKFACIRIDMNAESEGEPI